MRIIRINLKTNFTYDANGNLTQKTRGIEWWKYYYDYENRLTKVEHFDGTNTTTLGQYFYDSDGKRIKKQENGETVVYIYAGIQVIYEKVIESGKETKYIGRVAKIEKVNGNETTTFFHTDHLGSTRAVTDSTGNLTATLQYDPFGEVRSGSSDGVRYTYTGKEQDATGLYYYGARFYDPEIGRFITRDTFPGRTGNPQTQNRYSYVLNNPMKYIDPSGNEAFDWTEFWEDVAAGLFTPSDWGWDNFGSTLGSEIERSIAEGDLQKATILELMKLQHEGFDITDISPLGNGVFFNMNGEPCTINFNPNWDSGGKLPALGTTQPLLLGGVNITLYRGAFFTRNRNGVLTPNWEKLFHILGHELVHADLYTSGKFNILEKKYGANATFVSDIIAWHWNLDHWNIAPVPNDYLYTYDYIINVIQIYWDLLTGC